MPPKPMKGARFLLLLLIISSAASVAALARVSDEKPAEMVLLEKRARKLTLLRGGTAIRVYRVALGSTPKGPKICQGDGRTPEGRYMIRGRNRKSQYHWSLRVSYPNKADKVAAGKMGCNPGGDIFIHGLPNGYGWIAGAHTLMDWTQGCIAVTDREIEEIWSLVPDGTPMNIIP